MECVALPPPAAASASKADAALHGRRRPPASAQALPPLPQGTAIAHEGNVTHSVSVRHGERWSLIVFLFEDCAAQRRFFGEAGLAPKVAAASSWWDALWRRARGAWHAALGAGRPEL